MVIQRRSTWARMWASTSITGWRQAAVVNTAVVSVAGLVLLVVLVLAAVKAGGIQNTLFFYSGACDSDSLTRMNVGLHLLLNVISTAILASSNFFMQVLNAPSRDEVIKAHEKGTWLNIGIPSIRNAFQVSRFKTRSWFVFFLSSIPLHLLLNSTVFQTDNRGSNYQLTIATEAFTHGGAFRGPGASLVIPDGREAFLNTSATYSPATVLEDYLDPNSSISVNISSTAANSASWDRLTAFQCKTEYAQCHGLRGYRDVVVVIDPQDVWTRQSLWNSSAYPYEAVMDQALPGGIPNNLWYSAQCAMQASIQNSVFQCSNGCASALNYTLHDKEESWNMNVTGLLGGNSTYLRQNPMILSVSYCLVERLEHECRLGLSVPLLLAVTVCAAIKLLQCLAVLKYLDYRQSLVTLGDAIDAFIRDPDPHTFGHCNIAVGMEQDANADWLALVSGPQRWHRTPRRRAAAVSRWAWCSTYTVFVSCLAMSILLLAEEIPVNQGLRGTLGPSDSNSVVRGHVANDLVLGALAVNSPQLVLSFCYLLYNGLFTQMQMGLEWALLSTRFKGLRVTEPRGEQYATYRLQLPYRYSIPLIVMSIFLHWMMSNTFYTMVGEGGYFNTSSFNKNRVSINAGPSTTITFGYSTVAIFAMAVIFAVMLLVPIVLGMLRLPGYMNVVGSNSRAISAACHVSSLSRPSEDVEMPEAVTKKMKTRTRNRGGVGDDPEAWSLALNNDDLETSTDNASEHTDTSDQDVDQLRRHIAQSEIKWGEVEMPSKWHCHYSEFEESVGHLGFGVEADKVSEPREGQWYA